MKNVLKVIFVIIGTLIGAGFISGQEMYIFFYSYGLKGIIGLLVCSLLISFIIYKTCIIIIENDVKSYKEFLEKIGHTSKKKYLNTSYINNIIVNIFIFITFCIMISGFGAYFEQELKINSILGSSILAIICFIVLRKNVKGIVKASEILVPFIIIFICIIGMYNIKIIDLYDIKKCLLIQKQGSWLISSILYSSYNIILLLPVIVTLKTYIKNKKEAKKISIITAVIVFLLAVTLFLILTTVNINLSELEMPIAAAVVENFPQFKIIYGLIILISIFTTSISLGISFLKNTSKNKKNYTQISLIMCITSVILSKIGFSNLINLLYPVFGILGLVQIKNIIFK